MLDEGNELDEEVAMTAHSDEEISDVEDDVDEREDQEQKSVRSGSKTRVLGRGDVKEKKRTTEFTVSAEKAVFKQKTLILSSRGITHRMRHMMKDLAMLLPHSKSGMYDIARSFGGGRLIIRGPLRRKTRHKASTISIKRIG